MAKCRLLYQENEELGRMISSGRIAKLEGELALQKSYSEEVKKSQSGEYSFFMIIPVCHYRFSCSHPGDEYDCQCRVPVLEHKSEA